MYALKKKLESYLPVNLLGPGPRLIKKRIYRAAVSQRFRNTALGYIKVFSARSTRLTKCPTYCQGQNLSCEYETVPSCDRLVLLALPADSV